MVVLRFHNGKKDRARVQGRRGSLQGEGQTECPTAHTQAGVCGDDRLATTVIVVVGGGVSIVVPGALMVVQFYLTCCFKP